MSIHARGIDPHEPLEAVLRAASVPGHPEELAGEHAAMAAFLAAAPAPRRRLLARVLTVKALVIGGVTLSTGTVLAMAGGVFIPILRNEPAPTTPVEVPAVIRTSESAVTPPTGPSSATTEPPAGESSTRQPPPDECGDCSGREGKQDKQDDNGRPGKDKDGKGGQPPSTEPADATAESSRQTQTPDSPAHGAVTAVPPRGAEPPSPGD